MAHKQWGDEPSEQLWGTVVREAIATSNRLVPPGGTIAHGVAYELPSRSREHQFRAIGYLLEAVAVLQTLTQLLADELDRREVPLVARSARSVPLVNGDRDEGTATIHRLAPHQPFETGAPAG